MRQFLLCLAGFWLTGIILGVTIDSWDVVVVPGSLFLISAALFFRPSRPRGGFLVWGVACVLLLGLGYVHGLAAIRQQKKTVACTPSLPFIGEVAQLPQDGASGTRLFVRSETCAVYVTAAVYVPVSKGDEVEVVGNFRSLDEIAVTSSGFAKYLRREGLAGAVTFGEVKIIRQASPMLGWWREALSRRISILYREPEGSVAKAMLLADRGGIPAHVQEAFRATGVSHILAISGLHVSLLLGLLAVATVWLPLSGWKWAAAVLPLLWLYIAMVGWPVSATRAGIFWTIFLLSRSAGWLVSLPTVLFAALIGMMTQDPLIIFDVGFLLSFGAVAGIGLLLFLSRGAKRVQMLMVPLGALLTTWPIVGQAFEIFPVYSLLANLAVVPLAGFFLFLVVMSLGVSVLGILPALPIAFGARMIWETMFNIVAWCASLPGAVWTISGMPAWLVAAYYAGLLGAAAVLLARQKRSWREIWQ